MEKWKNGVRKMVVENTVRRIDGWMFPL
jgi:hypothetical protein